jgi:hypothetical protein
MGGMCPVLRGNITEKISVEIYESPRLKFLRDALSGDALNTPSIRFQNGGNFRHFLPAK